jgi:putative ABC transport system permease protein
VGNGVQIAGETYPVAGIVNPGIRPAKADIYMPFEEARHAIDRRMGSNPVGGEANVILVEVRSASVQDEAIAAVKSLLPGLLISSYACYVPAATVMGMDGKAAVVLAMVIALCALVVAMKTHLASVLERRHDIAILKAIGWTDGSVLRQVLAESLLVAVVGSIFGCLIAVVLLAWAPLNLASGIPNPESLRIDGGVLGVSVLLAAAGGLMAGAIPAILAARERPAQALRRP